ncbi:type VII secretion protein EssB [Bacillus sp. B1-b2]|uniref:type VII secretion protein EssB n=1 Tax=Bacillus sp. B1-b2 TaxID=2653201 RepID=UPI0012616BAF|nr:type VII secretion protein EssB [Bacillus sp. B1-b2]KAB7667782.1 type VII secretion protein EssB [Bacillus sp. B1-b2]
MPNEYASYMEKKLDAVIQKEDQQVTFSFQIEKIKMNHLLEVGFLEEVDSQIKRNLHKIEDVLQIEVQLPKTFIYDQEIFSLKKKDRYIIAHQLIERVRNHSLSRLHLFICPENIAVDQGLTSYFLHYGVKESIPPYEENKEEEWLQLKAMTASLVDNQYSFDQYVAYYETLKLSDDAAEIMKSDDYNSLLSILNQAILLEKEERNQLVELPRKKWRWTRYGIWATGILLIPAIIYSIYSLFFLQPKHENIIDAHRHFLASAYSDVINNLESYDLDSLPIVTQYELATAYISSADLSEEQRSTVQNTVTLQSDTNYYAYWIKIGRGEAKEALENARFLEDRSLIMYALLEYQAEVQRDDSLNSEERQQQINEIENELKKYEQDMKDESTQEDSLLEDSNSQSSQEQGETP